MSFRRSYLSHRFAVVIRIFYTCSAEVLTFLAEFISLKYS